MMTLEQIVAAARSDIEVQRPFEDDLEYAKKLVPALVLFSEQARQQRDAEILLNIDSFITEAIEGQELSRNVHAWKLLEKKMKELKSRIQNDDQVDR